MPNTSKQPGPKKVLVAGGLSSSIRYRKATRKFQAYLQQAVGADVQTSLAYLDELIYDIAPGKFQVYDARNHQDLDEIDSVFLRGMYDLSYARAYYISRYCAWMGKDCITDYSLYFPADKIAQTILFLEAGAPFLRTLYCPNNHRLVDAASERLGYPFILKAIMASHGNSNYLVKSPEQAAKIVAAEPRTDFMAQEYCPNNFDYRLLFIGDQHLVFRRSGVAGSHLNNTSKGGRANMEEDKLPPALVGQARSLCDSLGLKLAGVDIIPHLKTGELYFLEINVQPQLLTGAFLERKKALLRQLLQAD